MNDEQNQTATTNQSIPLAAQIRSEAKGKVNNACKESVVRNRVVDDLVEQELAKRTNLLAGALTKRDEVHRNIEKTRKSPEIKQFTQEDIENGSTKPSLVAFSESQQKEIANLVAQLNKIDKAIEMACNVENPDFSKLADIK